MINLPTLFFGRSTGFDGDRINITSHPDAIQQQSTVVELLHAHFGRVMSSVNSALLRRQP